MTTRDETSRAPAAATSAESPAGSREEGADRTTAAEVRRWNWLEASPGKLLAGALFGVIFGFLLQKGGAAKFDILIGVLLLENFVVVKIMLSAIIVGMLGVCVLARLGILQPQISETRYGANIVGGLIFGVGFGLLAYCPGTCAAAVGQGNLDALVGLLGLIAGSYAFALSSRFGGGALSRWGNAGKLTVPELLHVPAGLVVAIAAPLLVGVLVLIELYGP